MSSNRDSAASLYILRFGLCVWDANAVLLTSQCCQLHNFRQFSLQPQRDLQIINCNDFAPCNIFAPIRNITIPCDSSSLESRLFKLAGRMLSWIRHRVRHGEIRAAVFEMFGRANMRHDCGCRMWSTTHQSRLRTH